MVIEVSVYCSGKYCFKHLRDSAVIQDAEPGQAFDALAVVTGAGWQWESADWSGSLRVYCPECATKRKGGGS